MYFGCTEALYNCKFPTSHMAQRLLMTDGQEMKDTRNSNSKSSLV